jgi:uncharacterized protein YndB with AHSA1/START domain
MSTNELTIKAPPQRVWDVLADGWLYPLWVVGAARMRRVDPAWPEVGTRIHHSVGLWPFLINDHTEVLEMRRGEFLSLRARAWPAGAAEIAITLTPNGEHTDVRLQETVTSGPGALLPPPIEGLSLRWRNSEALQRLASIAEQRTP